jgi:NAD(P)-dependent dehydrogenase (short-subunit alcohol dehydrogenase family)
MNKKRILITGAGSGFGEGAALGLAAQGHDVIATVQISPQVFPLRAKAEKLGLTNLRVEKLDILDKIDVAAALEWDFDVLFSNAAYGEGGPISEIPMELVRLNYETNVFAPLDLAQRVVRKWITSGQPGKIVFMTSVLAIISVPGFGCYGSTKHAMQAIAEAMAQEVEPFNIKIQTINPGAYATGYNETMAETAFKWLDDSKNFTKRADLKAAFKQLFAMERDPKEVIEQLIKIVPSDVGEFRNIIPQFQEEEIEQDEQSIAHAAI